jgi:subtilisin family serine protease
MIGLDQLLAAAPTLDGVDDATGIVQRIAVIDTGIDIDHIGLAGTIVAGVNMAANAPYGSTDPNHYDDGHGHGTFVAGVIASGLADPTGICPEIELVGVRVLADDGSGSLVDVANGLDWIVDNAEALNITTVNISLGFGELYAHPEDVPDLYTYNRVESALATLEDRGVVTVAATGNDGSAEGMLLPAIYDSVLSVSAVDLDDAIADFSNRNEHLEALAPGTDITSLRMGGGTRSGGGTSYAAPLVTGSIALIRESYQQFTDDLPGTFDTFTDRVIDLLDRTGVEVTDPDTGLVYDRIDLYGAVSSVYAEYGQPLIGGASPAPEPASIIMLLVGVALIACDGRHRRSPAAAPHRSH